MTTSGLLTRNVALFILVLCLAVACGGGSSDRGPYPWITGSLMPVGCETEGFDCFILTVTGKGEGSGLGTCQVYAQDVEFTQLDPAMPSPFTTEQFNFTSGQELRFRVEVPPINDERFLRWAVDCLPGARA